MRAQPISRGGWSAVLVAAFMFGGSPPPFTPGDALGWSLGVAKAHADDDGDDGDDDDDDRPPPSHAARELFVSGVSEDDLRRLRAAGFVVLARRPSALLGHEMARIRVPRRLSLARARERVGRLLPNAAVDFNHFYRPGELACAPGRCPAFSMIGWPESPSICSVSVSLGMIDTAVDLDDPALRGQMIEIVAPPAARSSATAHAHGTAIAALLVGRPEGRTRGLLPHGRLVAVNAFEIRQGALIADAYRIVGGLDSLAERGIRVANLSFAGPRNAVLERAVGSARARDMVLVAAAGNQGPRAPPVFPAAYEGVIAVTAVDAEQRPYRNANTGGYVDLAAPGVRLWTAGGRGRYRSGTSYAVPFVTATLAAGFAATPERSTEKALMAIEARAIDLGAPGRDPVFGAGLLQVGGECGGPS